MSSTLSFQGVSSGLQTDSLVSAIISASSGNLDRLKAKKTSNTSRSTALSTISDDLSDLTLSMAKVYDALKKRAVSSTDADNTYVTATATGAANGSYQVEVASVATKGKLSATLNGSDPTNLAVADPNAAILTSDSGTFAVQGTDGAVKTFTLGTNSLYGLRDAINASGAGVTATVVNTGSGTNPYQLVLTSDDEGLGQTEGKVTLAAVKNADDSDTTVVSSLGIASGTVDSATKITGGLSSSGSNIATNAVFSVNGVQVTRESNTVKDVVDGITFNLKKGGSGNSTTLAVSQDTDSAVTAMNDLVSKYNTLVNYYQSQATVSQDASGNDTSGPLAGDSTAKSIMSQVRSALLGTASGISSSAAYKSVGSIGLKISSGGTLSLDETKFKEALKDDPEAVSKLFSFSGTTTNGSVTFSSAGSSTATGDMGFDLTYGSDGAVAGTLTYGGTTYDVSGANGTIQGPTGSPLEGLSLKVTGSGSGTMTLSRGVGQKLQDVISNLTSYSGIIENTRTSLDEQNKTLSTRIDSAQALLDKKEASLKEQFDAMEATIAELKSLASYFSS